MVCISRRHLRDLCSFAAPLALLTVAGCAGAPGEADGSDEVGSVSQAEFFGTGNPFGAETAVTTSRTFNGLGEFVMTANANDDAGFLTFNSGSRQIRPGTSLMIFKVLAPDDEGGNILASGRARAPSGWSVLWGDPAITRHRANSDRVYLANLAIPTSKFPASGIIDGPVNPSGLPANFCGAFIGGACIARSSNGGRSFAISSTDCVRRTSTACPNGSFYDGSALETSSSGVVYAAFNDVFRSAHDVYLAQTQTGPFARVTDPPLAGSTFSHPRLKIGPNGLYMLVWDGSNLRITRYPAGTSRTGTWTTPVLVSSGVTSDDNIFLSDRSIRLGPQYNLDIGTNEFGATEVRVVFAVSINGKHHLRVAKCSTGSTISCSVPSIWTTEFSGGEQWGPAIATGNGFQGSPFWAITFYNNQNFPTGNQVQLWTGSLPNSNSFGTVLRENFSQIPCPDLRGFWGDYDYMSTGNTGSGPGGLTIRGFTLSPSSSCTRDNFTSVTKSDSYSSILQ
jgi:hypothetical protein